METADIWAAMLNELGKAEQLHPHWPEDQVHAAAVMCEEAGETLRAALQYNYEMGPVKNIRKEAIQTGAMVIRLLENLPDK